MTKAALFQLCLDRARRMVAAYRATAPEGCDPQNSWVAIGVGVAGVAVSAGTSAYNSSKQKSAANQVANSNKSSGNKLRPIDFPNMPAYIPADFSKVNQAATTQDRIAYGTSDADFRARHPGVFGAEKAFEAQTLKDQTGDSKFMPQMQSEAVNAGLGSALDAFGDAGPTLARGSGAEADVAKNLGLSVIGFQDRNRQNAAQSLSLAEQIFPRRQIGLSGQDAASISMGNLSAQNAWNQADYAARTDQLEFNQKIKAGNLATQIQSNNALAASQASLSAAQAQMYGSMASSAIGTAGRAYGNYQNNNPTITYVSAPPPTTTGITSGA